MGPLTMSEAERDAFRADVHVGLLAVERRHGPSGDDIVVRIRPERWHTSDFSKLDLPSP